MGTVHHPAVDWKDYTTLPGRLRKHPSQAITDAITPGQSASGNSQGNRDRIGWSRPTPLGAASPVAPTPPCRSGQSALGCPPWFSVTSQACLV
jgi:hypothetical protein